MPKLRNKRTGKIINLSYKGKKRSPKVNLFKRLIRTASKKKKRTRS